MTMVCHANVLRGNAQKRLIKRENIDGIDVISIKNSYSNNMGSLRRIWSFLKFLLISTFVVYREKHVDLVFASSTPLTVAFPALVKRFLQRVPYIFEVRDLWPEAPIQLGFIRNPLLIRFLRWFEKTTYRKAEHVIALSPGMVEGVTKYISKERVSMIPNMAKIDEFWPREKSAEVNDKYGISNDSFKLVYFGAMGVANGIDYLIREILQLDGQGIENIEFIFVGSGAKQKDLEELSDKLKSIKLVVLDRQPMKEVSAIVNNSDVSICTFSEMPILKTNSPNKLFDTLSAGKPSIVNSDGWTKEIVEQQICGFYVNPSKPGELGEKILFLRNNQHVCEMMGKNARRLAEKEFDKSILCKQVVSVFESKLFSHPSAS